MRIGHLRSFQTRNEQFFFAPLPYAQSPQADPQFRKIKEVKGLSASGGVARIRTYSTSHKQPRRLTPRLRKSAISGWKLTEVLPTFGGSPVSNDLNNRRI
jgi:hypothetical protein